MKLRNWIEMLKSSSAEFKENLMSAKNLSSYLRTVGRVMGLPQTIVSVLCQVKTQSMRAGRLGLQISLSSATIF